MDQQEIMALEAAHTSGVYPKRLLAIVRGQGARVWDADGNEYIDCAGGQGAANLGHAHPAHRCGNLAAGRGAHHLPRDLLQRPPLCRAAGCAGRGRAGRDDARVPVQLRRRGGGKRRKVLRLSTGRIGIAAAMRGFHGRTMGALSATWTKAYREPFEPLVPGFLHVPYNDLAALDANVCDDTAAVILEVIQGEGGVHLADPAFLAGAQALCRERGAMLIVDEIQTGYGRTGKLFASEHYGIEPDLMTVAKSMAGGLPMGACLIGPRVGTLTPMSHGSTFGGNPLACAAALATLEVMRTDDLPGRAARLGDHLLARLRTLNSPIDPRGARARVDRRHRSAGQGDAHPAEVAGARRPGPARRFDRLTPPAAAGHRGS